MTDREPYIHALSDACPGGGWVACALSANRIRSLAFEEVQILLGHDIAPCLTVYRRAIYLPTDPAKAAIEVYRQLQSSADEMERGAKVLRRMCFPMGG